MLGVSVLSFSCAVEEVVGLSFLNEMNTYFSLERGCLDSFWLLVLKEFFYGVVN